MRESLCLNQSRMPQLDKFTYFTQFFWSCLFLFTFYLGSKLNIARRLSLLYLIHPAFQRVVFWLKSLFFFFVLIRTGFLLWHNLHGLLWPHQTLFMVLPSRFLSETVASGPGMGGICTSSTKKHPHRVCQL